LSENHVLVDSVSGTKYFLKRYRFDSEEKIVQIHSVKNYFSERGIPVIVPIQTNTGETFFSFEGFFFALFPYVVAREIVSKDLSDEAIISLGQTLARIHLAGKDAVLPDIERFQGWNKEKLLQKSSELMAIIDTLDTRTEFDQQALIDLKLRSSIIESNTHTFEDFELPADHLIHGDYHGGNVFFDEHDHISHVFDFEKSLVAPRTFELFRSTVFLFFGTTFDTETIRKARLYVQSYLYVYPASEEELRKGFNVFYLRFVHGFWVEGEHYLKGNTRVDQFLVQDCGRVRYLSEHGEELITRLIEKN
jgi:Ser/Thr protein kinase RdoA (MazF antagonist)